MAMGDVQLGLCLPFLAMSLKSPSHICIIQEASAVLAFHTVPQMAVNFSCPFLYSFPHSPLSPSPSFYCPHPSIKNLLFYFPFLGRPVPHLSSLTLPNVCGHTDCSLLINDPAANRGLLNIAIIKGLVAFSSSFIIEYKPRGGEMEALYTPKRHTSRTGCVP